MSGIKLLDIAISPESYNRLKVFSVKKGTSVSNILNYWIKNISGDIKFNQVYNKIIKDPRLNLAKKHYSIKITEENIIRLKFIARNNLKRENLSLEIAIKNILLIIIYFGLSIIFFEEKDIFSKYYPGQIIYIGRNVDNISPGHYFIDTATLKYNRQYLSEKEIKELYDYYFIGEKDYLEGIRTDNWLLMKNMRTDNKLWRPLNRINYLENNYNEAIEEYEMVQKFKEKIRSKEKKYTYLIIKEKHNSYGKNIMLDRIIYSNEKYKIDELDNETREYLGIDYLKNIYFLDDLKELMLNKLRVDFNEDQELDIKEV